MFWRNGVVKPCLGRKRQSWTRRRELGLGILRSQSKREWKELDSGDGSDGKRLGLQA